MSRCIAGIAVALMVLKMATWLAVVRFHGSGALNAAYVACTLLMLWSYALAVGVQPTSRPPIDNRVRAAHAEESDAYDDEEEDDQVREVTRYCERCDIQKPALVHHCSSCHRCVFRMDHHCPWTNNCVGWDNKKYFVLFLVYTSLSCLLFNAMEWELVWRPQQTQQLQGQRHKPVDDDMSLLQLTWALSLFVGAILAGYLLFHIWLLYRGMTTFEFLMSKRGELEGNSLVYNVRVYFGSNVALWWLPVAPALDPTMGGKDSRQHHRRETRQLMV